MHTSEVAEGIHWLEHAHVNVYFVEQDGRVMTESTYERAIDLATGALKDQGFGVLTTIDVQQTGLERCVAGERRLRRGNQAPDT